MKEIWINRRGQLRWGWVLCAAAIVYAAAAVGVPMLYWSAYEFFMNVWNVTDANIHLAPGAVKFLYQWSNVLAQLCRNGVLVYGARVLLKAGQEVEKRTGSAALLAKGAAMGAGCVALAWCVLMLLGSVRLGTTKHAGNSCKRKSFRRRRWRSSG